MAKGKRGTIGILTGGGDIPGLNQAIRGVTLRALQEGFDVIGIRRGWGGLIDIVRDDGADNSACCLPLTGTWWSATVRGRHVPALLAHAARAPCRQGRAGAPQRQVHGREERPHRRGHRQPGVPGRRLPGAHRRRRHAQLRRRAGPPRLPGGGHPQDDGQRRARHRLLHGLRHLREPHHRDGPPGDHLGGLARAHRGARGLRPLRRFYGAAADFRRRRRPLRHPRAQVRHGAPRRAARGRPQRAARTGTRSASSARAPCPRAATWCSWAARRTCSATPSSAASART